MFEENINRDTLPLHLEDWDKCEVTWDKDSSAEDEHVSDTPCYWYGFDLPTGEDIQIPIASKGEILAIIGREKSRKSTLLQTLLMTHFTQGSPATLNFYASIKDPLIYHFDTEQPKSRTRKSIERFCRICGVDQLPKNYKVFNIRKYSHTQKLEIISHIIDQLFIQTGRYPDIIAIDQIADLTPSRDVNDQIGADNAFSHIVHWQELTGALMILVMHTNRGGNEANGKLGVIIDQKVDVQFLVSYDKESELSTVIHKLARENRIPKFTFRQDFSGRPKIGAVFDKDYDFTN